MVRQVFKARVSFSYNLWKRLHLIFGTSRDYYGSYYWPVRKVGYRDSCPVVCLEYRNFWLLCAIVQTSKLLESILEVTVGKSRIGCQNTSGIMVVVLTLLLVLVLMLF